MTRRRLLLFAAAACLLLLLAASFLLRSPMAPAPISEKTFMRLRQGMSAAEVERFLGRAPDNAPWHIGTIWMGEKGTISVLPNGEIWWCSDRDQLRAAPKSGGVFEEIIRWLGL